MGIYQPFLDTGKGKVSGVLSLEGVWSLAFHGVFRYPF